MVAGEAHFAEKPARLILICGPSRSGTALMRSILNLHSQIHLAAETHYFDDLRAHLGRKATTALSHDERKRCEDYFLALGHRPYSHKGDPERSKHSRADLRQLADEVGEGGDAYFESFCRLEARVEGKDIWGEKTPRHIFRISEILNQYPDAKIICMLRDPRAVIVSYRDWRNQGGFDFEKDPGHRAELERDHERARRSYNLLLMSMLWRSTVRAAEGALKKFGPERIRLQKYEDLATQPGQELRSMCAWLHLPFEEAILAAPMSNSSFSKYQEGHGVTTQSVARWRKKLSDVEIGIIQSVCGKDMGRLGYERESVGTPRLRLAASWAALPVAIGRAILLNRSRMGNLPGYIWRRLRPAAS